jgi:hypothetical protein
VVSAPAPPPRKVHFAEGEDEEMALLGHGARAPQ